MKTKTFLAVLALCAMAALSPARAQSWSNVTPVQIDRTAEPVFPPDLLRTHSKDGGKARVMLNVSAEGALEDALVIGYTARGFADEAMWAVTRWKYQPARLRGEAVSSTFELLFTFEQSGAMVSMLDVDRAAEIANSAFRGDEAYRPRQANELDRPLVATKTVNPAYTTDRQKEGLEGEVAVDFFIDEQGAVRMPSVQEQNHNMLGSLAVAALRQWTFEPPTMHGKPVLVKARQIFRFNPGAPVAAN